MPDSYPHLEEAFGLPVQVDHRVPPGVAYLVPTDPRQDGPITLPVHLAVGSHVYPLGEITGDNADELSNGLAEMADWLARLLRGPEDTPAPPCEGCGTEMVYRRGHPGRFTVVSRDEAGRVDIFGVHYVTTCVMDREQRERMAAEGWPV